jgi:outer membrane biosynthesis protein TonB
MQRTLNVVVLLASLFSAFALSSCASKPKDLPVTEPAPAQKIVAETPLMDAPVLAGDQHRHGESAAEAPVPEEQPVAVEKPAAVEVASPVRQKVVKAKRTVPKVVPPPVPAPAPEPAPASVPAPAVESAAPVAQVREPSPPEPMAPPVEEAAEESFLEKYWLWLAGLVIAVAGVVVWQKKSQAGKS